MSRLTGTDALGLFEAYQAVYNPQELTEEQVWEEVELWVESLLEEGYDLSDYTWEEMYESYLDEKTAMAKRGYDETEIRNKIKASTGGGEVADRATELASQQTFGQKGKGAPNPQARQRLAAKQRGDFRKTTSSSPGLHGYGHKSNDPEVKAKQAARGAQRGALTPAEKKQMGEQYNLVLSYLIDEGYANSLESARVIIENMSEEWRESIVEANAGPSTPVKIDSKMGVVPNPGAGRVKNVRLKPQFLPPV